jgi:hypothetical protein
MRLVCQIEHTYYNWFSFESVAGSSWVAMEVQDLASHSQIANPKPTPIVPEIWVRIVVPGWVGGYSKIEKTNP